MSRLSRAAAAGALGALLGGLALPLASLAFEREAVPFCCRGRCCCTGEAPEEREDRPCLRLRCGCGTRETVATLAPLRLEALLPRLSLPVPACVPPAGTPDVPERPVDRPDAPPVPPPKLPSFA